MKQTITIDVPEGKVVKFNAETNMIEFIDKEPIRSKSWEEFIKNHPKVEGEWYINSFGYVGPIHSDTRTKSQCNNLETKEDAEGILALIQLTRLHDEWVGDWNIIEEEKIDKPWFSIAKTIENHEIRFRILQRYCDMPLLSFPAEEMAEEFLEYHKSLIEKAIKFIY